MYKKARSAKLDSLVEILWHHLANDGAPAITPTHHTEEAPSLSQPQPQPQQQIQGLPPDKIIVYSFFPSSFGLIKMVGHCFLCQRSELINDRPDAGFGGKRDQSGDLARENEPEEARGTAERIPMLRPRWGPCAPYIERRLCGAKHRMCKHRDHCGA
jgi:hypothetical protein